MPEPKGEELKNQEVNQNIPEKSVSEKFEQRKADFWKKMTVIGNAIHQRITNPNPFPIDWNGELTELDGITREAEQLTNNTARELQIDADSMPETRLNQPDNLKNEVKANLNSNEKHKKLDNKNEIRWNIDAESLELMKGVKERLPDLQSAVPEVVGVGFFGSRTQKTNRPNSDLDMTIFYQAECIPYSSKDSAIQTKIQNTVKESYQDSGISVHLLALDSDKDSGISIHLTTENIGIKKLDKDIDHVITIIDKLHAEGKPVDIGKFGIELANLAEVFELVIGDRIYSAREYILNRLKSLPTGITAFYLIMDRLSRWERHQSRSKGVKLEPFTGYPQSLEEATTYFLSGEENNYIS